MEAFLDCIAAWVLALGIIFIGLFFVCFFIGCAVKGYYGCTATLSGVVLFVWAAIRLGGSRK